MIVTCGHMMPTFIFGYDNNNTNTNTNTNIYYIIF